MRWFGILRPRIVVLVLLWALPALIYTAIGVIALYQTGWLVPIAWSLPLMWLAAWLVGLLWRPLKGQRAILGKPLRAREFWTPRDEAAIAVVETFRAEMVGVDRFSITQPNRYINDAQQLAQRLADHYYGTSGTNALHPVTIVEILAVIHLAAEDLEGWFQANIPGSDLATFGHFERLPLIARTLDLGQSIFFLATAITNPAKLLSYPLWRKAGSVTNELQDELVRAFYYRYLREIGFYLIEMYSGRLKGGGRHYRETFGTMSRAVHAARGDVSKLAELSAANTTIAVMGQVKAGKSSLINALMHASVAQTSVLPETRSVQRYDYQLPDTEARITLLDTPGYSETDMGRRQRAEIETASDSADIILLVMAANSSARQSDVQLVLELEEHYRRHPHLKPPPVIAVLTHLDLLRPIGQWTPPYNWRNPSQPKEQAMAKAVDYIRQLFGTSLAGVACVNSAEAQPADTSVEDELVPLLVAELDQGHSAAIVRLFYSQLNRERFSRLTGQLTGLLKTFAQSLLD